VSRSSETAMGISAAVVVVFWAGVSLLLSRFDRRH
jgi:hypothetical protein